MEWKGRAKGTRKGGVCPLCDSSTRHEVQRGGQREGDVNPMRNTPVFAHLALEFSTELPVTTGHPFIYRVQKLLTHLSRWKLVSEMFPPSTFENPFSIFHSDGEKNVLTLFHENRVIIFVSYFSLSLHCE